jgi:8-oxo-dGTP pyrophosphatase MutT (NUDIX family)
MQMKTTKDNLRQALGLRENRNLSQLTHDYACVAVILHETSAGDLDLAVIRRAEIKTDPWAGHLALPGGRREEHDADDIQAAVREAREEIGISLNSAQALGQIHDIQARRGGTLLKFFLRPVVFLIEEKGQANLDPMEVAQLYWIPLSHFLEPKNHLLFAWDHNGKKVQLPGIRFPDGKIFWGLSYMLMTDFIERLAEARLDTQMQSLAQLSDLSHWHKY